VLLSIEGTSYPAALFSQVGCTDPIETVIEAGRPGHPGLTALELLAALNAPAAGDPEGRVQLWDGEAWFELGKITTRHRQLALVAGPLLAT